MNKKNQSSRTPETNFILKKKVLTGCRCDVSWVRSWKQNKWTFVRKCVCIKKMSNLSRKIILHFWWHHYVNPRGLKEFIFSYSTTSTLCTLLLLLDENNFQGFLRVWGLFRYAYWCRRKFFFEIGYWKTFRLLSRFGRSLEKYYKLFKSLRLFGALISDETFWLIFMKIRKN